MMNRSEFMAALETELSNVTMEEREEALKFYHEYLDEAGPAHEQSVLDELGSPHTVANIIRANLGISNNAAPQPKKAAPTLTLDGPDWAQTQQAEEQKPTAETSVEEDIPPQRPHTYAQETPKKQYSSRNTFLFILIITSPIWLGLLISIISVLVSLLVAFIGLIVSGIGAMVASVVALIGAVLSFGVAPANSIVTIGISLGTLAVGSMIMHGGFWLLRKGLPFLFQKLTSFIHTVLGKAGINR